MSPVIRCKGNTYRKVTKSSKSTKNLVSRKKIEYKQFAQGAGYANFSTSTFAASHLTPVPQGVRDTERIGDKVYARALHLRLGIQCNIPGVAAPSNLFVNARVIVFQYKKTDSTPVAAEMFLLGGGMGTYNSYSARNIDYMDKYVILYDKMVQVRGFIGTPAAALSGVAVPDQYMKYIKIKVPLKYAEKNIKYQAATTSSNNGLWLLVMSDQAPTTNNPSYMFDSNFTYTDM